MSIWMDVDAALAEVPVNILPLIDDTDFKSREVAIGYDAGGMDLVWNFVTTAGATTQTAVTPTTGGDYDWAHQGDGMYSIEIPASGGVSINNTEEGFGWFTGFCTGVLPWRGPIIGFRSAAINNALVDGATLVVASVSGAVGSVTGAVDSVTGAVGSVAGNVDGSTASVVGAVGSVAGNVDGSVGSVTAGVTLAADAIKLTSFDETTAWPLVAADSGNTEVARVGADGDTLEVLSDEIAALNDPTAAVVADAVWDELAVGHVDAGKAGQQLWTDLDAVLADTDELQTDDIPTVIGALNDPTAATIADAVWDEASDGHVDAGKAGQQLWTDLDAVLADTDELQADDYPTSIAAVQTTADAIETDTQDLQTQIGTAGDGLGDLGGMSDAMKTEVEAEANDALVALNLDHLAKEPTVGADMTAEVVDNTILSRVLASGDTSVFDPTTDSLQDIRAKLTDIETDTDELQTDDIPGAISGLNDPTAAAIADAVLDEAKGAHTGLIAKALPDAAPDAAGGLPVSDAGGLDLDTQIGTDIDAILADTDELQTDDLPTVIGALNDPAASAIADAVWDEASAGHVDAGKAGQQLWTDVDAILADTDELQTDDILTVIGGLNNVSTAQVNAEVDTALADVDLDHLIQVSAGIEEPTDGSYLDQIMHKDAGQSFDATTDSLEAHQDGAGTPPSAAAIADAVWDEDVVTAHNAADSAGGLIDDIATKADFKADVAGLATAAALTTAQADLDNADQYKADVDAIADQVWDEAAAGHVAVGSTGKALVDAGAAGDPWGVSLPGAYASGEAGDIIGNMRSDIWGHTPRTLTQTAAEVQAALEGSRITIHRGDDLSVTLTDLGNLVGFTELWYTAKKAEGHTDLRAVIQITESGGLVRILQAAAGTPANGSITVDNENAGDVTIKLAAVETAKLSPGQRLAYDIQMLKGGEILTLTESTVKVTADVTRAVTA